MFVSLSSNAARRDSDDARADRLESPAFDRNRDGKTDLSEDPVLGALPFIQAADVFIPSSLTHEGTISYQLISRGGGGARSLNAPDWDALTDQVELQWNDFEQLTF